MLFLKTAVCFNKLTLSGLCQFYLVCQTKTETVCFRNNKNITSYSKAQNQPKYCSSLDLFSFIVNQQMTNNNFFMQLVPKICIMQFIFQTAQFSKTFLIKLCGFVLDLLCFCPEKFKSFIIISFINLFIIWKLTPLYDHFRLVA